MSIRLSSLDQGVGLKKEFLDILRRNGMLASLTLNDKGEFYLKVKSHDSPLIEYKINSLQASALSSWGTTSSERKAWNTFTSIVAADFDLPKNFLSARSALSRVNMGQMKVNTSSGFLDERLSGFRAPIMGWAPRHHTPHSHGTPQEPRYGLPYVLDGTKDRLRPGEITPDGSGFYYKKENAVTASSQNQKDALESLSSVILKPNTYKRPEVAIRYKDHITSVGFTNELFQEVLSSHGIIVDKENKTLTICSEIAPADFSYDLTDEEVDTLTSNSLKDHSLEERLNIINSIIKDDFEGEITLDTLNSYEAISLEFKPEVLNELLNLSAQEKKYSTQENENLGVNIPQDAAIINGKDLHSLDANKGWYREGKHGREVEVGDIRVERILMPEIISKEEAKNFSSKVELLNKEEKPLTIDDIKDLENVNEELEGKTLSFQIGENEEEFKVLNCEKALDDKGYTLMGDRGQKIEVTYNELSDIIKGKEVSLEVKDSEGIFDHYAIARLKNLEGFTPNNNIKQEALAQTQVKYKMSAVIDGQVISHELSSKQYEKFMALDDFHRMKMFSQIFNEVDMKTSPEATRRLGSKIMAAIMAVGVVGSEFMRPRLNPEIFSEVHRSPVGVYSKPHVDTPETIASREFNTISNSINQGMTRGI